MKHYIQISSGDDSSYILPVKNLTYGTLAFYALVSTLESGVISLINEFNHTILLGEITEAWIDIMEN